MRDKNILIMAGGTGGHVYPALAVADNLKEKGFKLFWLGTSKGMEAKVVPDHGYPLLKINVAGVRGNGILRLLYTPFMLVIALVQALKIMIKVRPVAVLGMGGFASGPGGVAAWLMRIPLLIHEQNAIAGLTNRLLAPFCVSIMAAFPGAFKDSKKLTVTGNPVRNDIVAVPKPEQRYVERNLKLLKVLVLGGSLGARKLNEVIPKTFSVLGEEYQFEIKHQCGERHVTDTERAYKDHDVNVEVIPFINDMAEVYSWADIVICRAGALTIAELAAAGIGSILIPFPYAVDDHQTENAKYLASVDAAILIQEAQLNIEKLKEVLLKLYQAPEQLIQMAVKARSLAKPTATEDVAKICLEAIHA
ncbi:MAG: undecaprenyldiphospho-muramoylpentapeptide beta-N-acetylglucosaminyltransferase [Proteobacteria bacterium]|nr:undecaprenyldiphospho-muramoylpentapeptide beta-N-acetylglucosaminyltransferase [Pseudomonadota bacterium]NOG60090.1 undecaprenyldiphospho-muramoylpentapeptide beta-N-acetylglucosaminyltransferase [Pseudomonadota bacterium]